MKKSTIRQQGSKERISFRTYCGVSTMVITEGITAALMTSFFMLYLTDYSGIGVWAAALGSALLLGVRLFDAVNDPIQGWIIDRAKVGRFGKYKPFIIASILFMTVGVSCLFFIPTNMTSSAVVISLWVIFFYLLYDIGLSFFAPNLIYRTLTLDGVQRGKLMIGPRLVGMVVGMVSSGLIAIVSAVNMSINNMHHAFGITITTLLIVCAAISLLGIGLVKEKYHAPPSGKVDRVKLTDIFLLLKENAALKIRITSQLFDGFIWTFLFATALYYIKWAYCADLTTGVVDTERLGTMTLMASLLMFLPIVIGTVIATPIMRKLGSAFRFHRLLVLIMSLSCGALFLLEISGILHFAPFMLFVCMAITTLAIGCSYIPGESVHIECMDYEIYKNGRDRSALCNACNGFIKKAQGAISAAIIGILLTSIGYVVDSATDTYLGDLTRIPAMLTWFIVIMGLIPCILGLISWFILKHYPISDEVRADMRKTLEVRNTNESNQPEN